jgi:hypothetical protein
MRYGANDRREERQRGNGLAERRRIMPGGRFWRFAPHHRILAFVGKKADLIGVNLPSASASIPGMMACKVLSGAATDLGDASLLCPVDAAIRC